MKRLLGLFVVCATAIGCDGRLDATVTLRNACVSLSDSQIEALTVVSEADRQMGFTLTEEIESITNSCSSSDCFVCGVAIVNQVYGVN